MQLRQVLLILIVDRRKRKSPFSQVLTCLHFRTQARDWQQLTRRWLSVVVCGCLPAFGISLSAGSAHICREVSTLCPRKTPPKTPPEEACVEIVLGKHGPKNRIDASTLCPRKTPQKPPPEEACVEIVLNIVLGKHGPKDRIDASTLRTPLTGCCAENVLAKHCLQNRFDANTLSVPAGGVKGPLRGTHDPNGPVPVNAAESFPTTPFRPTPPAPRLGRFPMGIQFSRYVPTVFTVCFL